jgi:hypothetical protein
MITINNPYQSLLVKLDSKIIIEDFIKKMKLKYVLDIYEKKDRE